MDGSEVALVPSAAAAIKLSEKHGGLYPLMDRINLGSVEAATDVAFYGLGKKDSEREQLRAHVYGAGLRYLAPLLIRYVIALANGGKVKPAAPEVSPDA
jgi:hypothetical protein